jgi:hypothetical protein
MNWRILFVPVILLGVAWTAAAQDQRPPGGRPDRGANRQGGQQGGRGQRGDWNPQEMQQRMMEGLQMQLRASAEDWTALEPRLQRVMQAQRDARGGGGGGWGGMGGGRAAFGAGPGGAWGGPNAGRRGPASGPAADAQAGPPQDETPLMKATRELRDTLQAENPPAEEVAQRLAAYRAARDAADAELKTARDELRTIATQRQEAVLVMMGYLD